jgi:carbonic anhydrase
VVSSLKYAVEHLGGSLKIVVVLGHSGCGAVSAAVDVFLEPAQYLPLATSHSLRGILDRLLVVVQASAKELQDTFGPDIVRNPAYRKRLLKYRSL